MAQTVNVKSIIGVIVVLIIGLSLLPIVVSTVSDAIQGNLKYYTTTTTNAEFTDNADGWDNVVEGNATSGWSENTIYAATTDNDGITDNATWSQSLSFTDTRDVYSASLKLKYKLAENAGLSSVIIKGILDNTTDNVVIYQASVNDNSVGWISVDNDVKSYVTTSGTHAIRLKAELLGTGASVSLKVQYDDASLQIKTSGYEPMTGAPKVMLQLIPLFYVIALVLSTIYWAVGQAKK